MAFGVYIHIPFCTTRCDYCAFATWTDRWHLADDYVEACVSAARRELAGKPPATSLFFGGGTPSLLSQGQLARILDAVPLADGAEVTVECNPETVDAATLRGYRAAGITRLSFGVQSMVPHVLASLGRRHAPETVRRAAQEAAGAGFGDSYSVDLIFGASAETTSDWEFTLRAVLGFDPPPGHVSAYALTVEPGTPLGTDPRRHPDPDIQAERYLLAEEILADAGLAWYEISNWARPGSECLHNQLYWERGEYLGIGCAAHSHRIDPATGWARRWWNVRTPDRYIRLVAAYLPTEAAGEDVDPRTGEMEALQLALRTRTGVPATSLPGCALEGPCGAGGCALEGPYGGGGCVLEGACQGGHRWAGGCALGGLVAPAAGGRAVLTPRGRLLANEVALRLRPL
jgi:putative oxygen-independent coproporphyrinogen III oxidase